MLDPNYTPSTNEEDEIFEIKQRFMYSVFNRTIQVNIGKAIVRKHENNWDAQSIYAELLEEATRSTAAQLNISLNSATQTCHTDVKCLFNII